MIDIIKPWETPKENDQYTSRSRYFNHRFSNPYHTNPITTVYNRTNEVIDDDGCLWKRGDILKFSNCYVYPKLTDWREWFLLPAEMKRARIECRIKKPYIPVYASNQYAILMTRYRVIKDKEYATYIDYGSHIMMISGKCPGRLRRYFVKNPFSYVISYPYHNITKTKKRLCNILNKIGMLEFAKDLYSTHGNMPESRTMFVEEFQKRLWKG